MTQKQLLIIGHPYFKTQSQICQAIFKLLNKSNLNQILFLENEYDPLTNSFNEANTIKALENNDHIIFLFPLWWYSVPSRMKLWMDEPLSAYFTKHKKTSKTFTFIISCGRSLQVYTIAAGTFATIIQPLIAVFKYLGWNYHQTYVLFNANKSSETEIITFVNNINKELLN